MHRDYIKWHSPNLGRDMELLVFGYGGFPVLVFPTSMGRFFEYEDRGMVAAVAHKIDRGDLQLFCVDSVDNESWYCNWCHPADRVRRHEAYDRYLIHEIIPFVRGRNRSTKLGATGCSFGGYHAMNFALRHPDVVQYVVSMSGAFDAAHRLLDGYYDESAYYHTPSDFLPNLKDDWFLSRYRQNYYLMAVGEHDRLFSENLHMRNLLGGKGIPNYLDVWSGWCHDWPWWHQMAVKFL